MDKTNTIDYLEIPVKDIAASKTFFEQLFGWTFVDYGTEYCSFDDGRSQGGLYLSSTSFTVASGCPLIVFYNSALEATQTRVEECGGTIVKEIFAFPGGRRFHFADPNGNEYAIWSDQ